MLVDTHQITGLRELETMLKRLPRAMSNTVVRNALRKAGEPTRALAETTCPYDRADNWGGKHLRDSIKIGSQLNPNQRRGRRRIKEGAEVFVGSTSPLAHLVEFGTAERRRTGRRAAKLAKKGLAVSRRSRTGSTGVMPANPFFTQAWDATKDEALAIVRKELWAELAKAAKRLRSRAEKGTLSTRTMREMQRM